MTLGCIVFLLVTASLEIETISSAKTLTSCDIMLDSNMKINATLTDPILKLYKDQIKDFGYETNNINDYQSERAKIQFADNSNTISVSQHVKSV